MTIGGSSEPTPIRAATRESRGGNASVVVALLLPLLRRLARMSGLSLPQVACRRQSDDPRKQSTRCCSIIFPLSFGLRLQEPREVPHTIENLHCTWRPQSSLADARRVLGPLCVPCLHMHEGPSGAPASHLKARLSNVAYFCKLLAYLGASEHDNLAGWLHEMASTHTHTSTRTNSRRKHMDNLAFKHTQKKYPHMPSHNP
jgi:hypothetical protein